MIENDWETPERLLACSDGELGLSTTDGKRTVYQNPAVENSAEYENFGRVSKSEKFLGGEGFPWGAGRAAFLFAAVGNFGQNSSLASRRPKKRAMVASNAGRTPLVPGGAPYRTLLALSLCCTSRTKGLLRAFRANYNMIRHSHRYSNPTFQPTRSLAVVTLHKVKG